MSANESGLIPGPAEREKKEQAQRESQRETRDKLQVRFNGTLAFMTTVLVIVGSYQAWVAKQSSDAATKAANAAESAAKTASATLNSMEASGKETKTQIDRLIAEQHNTATSIADSFALSRRAFQLDERPYIHVSYRKPDIGMNVPLQALGDIGNVGKTFAMNIHITMKLEILGKDEGPHLNRIGNKIHTNETGMLIPNAAIHDVVTPLGSDLSQLSQNEIVGLTKGQKYISVHGTVEYSDLFNTRHWTHTCQWFAYAPGVFQSQSCGAYNRVDHN